MLNLRAFALVVVVTIAACGGAAGPSANSGTAPTERPTPTPVPGDSGSGSDPGSGGGSDPGPCCVGGPIGNPGPGGPNQNPLFGDATYLKPVQGLINQRAVNVQLVRAVVNADASATADLRWWSGVAPCSALDHVEMVKDESARSIRITVIEGSGPGDIACIDIAQLSATTAELGTLPSGTWTISAQGDAPAIQLDVP